MLQKIPRLCANIVKNRLTEDTIINDTSQLIQT